MEEGKKDAEEKCSELQERLVELEEIGTKLLKTEIRKLEQKVCNLSRSKTAKNSKSRNKCKTVQTHQ